ncbi:MAG TPA: c-type cytochrome, partial [Acidobacteriaceae bacterium]|nr:c-type cytochrome [Acidobacteriaceae bacterium]
MRRWALVAALPLMVALSGCESAPGAKAAEATAPRPEQVMDFKTLYATNCQACHGENGHGGPAMELGNPEYQALVDDATLRKWISGGMPGTEMPAFAQSAGGMLTDAQINAIIAGMRKEWAKTDAFGGATPPPYAQPAGGDAKRGAQVYQARCASCHEKPERQQVMSPVYLSLVSDQVLRTVIVAGRPDIGQPDWRLQPVSMNGVHIDVYAPIRPLAGQDVTDIVTYLGSLR